MKDDNAVAAALVNHRFYAEIGKMAHNAYLTAVGKDHDRAFAARFPMPGGVNTACRWGGRLCMSGNNLPVVGQLAEGRLSAARTVWARPRALWTASWPPMPPLACPRMRRRA